jgi:hypothetical protein
MKSREAFDLRLPVKIVHPIVAKIPQELTIHSEGRIGTRDGFGPSRLPQAAAQVIHCHL